MFIFSFIYDNTIVSSKQIAVDGILMITGRGLLNS